MFAAKTGLSRDDIVSLANVNKGRNVTFWPFRRLFAPLHPGGIDTFLGLVLNLAEIILGFVNEITHVFRDGILGVAQIICGFVECSLAFFLSVLLSIENLLWFP